MPTRTTAFSRRTGRTHQDPFDDIAGQNAPVKKKIGALQKIRSMFSYKTNPPEKYKVITHDDDNAYGDFDLDIPGTLIANSPRAAIAQASPRAAIAQASPRAAIAQASPPKTVFTTTAQASTSKSSNSQRSSSTSKSSNSQRSSSTSKSSNSQRSSSTSSYPITAAFKQALLEKGVIYHNGKITKSKIKKWKLKSKEIHTIILDNFQFIDDDLYDIFLEFLGSCTNLKNLIIKRKDTGELVKKEVDYFQEAFFLNIGKLENLELLELNSFHIKKFKQVKGESEFFYYFVILLSKLKKLEHLILINNYMYNNNANNLASLMFIENEVRAFEDSDSATYRYKLTNNTTYYSIYIDKLIKKGKTFVFISARSFYLNADGNLFIQDKKPEQYLKDFKTRGSILNRNKLLKEYGITILDT